MIISYLTICMFLHLSEMGDKKNPPFGSIPYIARPHPEQTSHTGQ